jgi:hypothetical protein
MSGYKPIRRPINKGGNKKKRKLIVRDWLHWVVWYVRIRKQKLLNE